MDGCSYPRVRALAVVVALMCLASAATTFAQQQTGTLTGTVVDDSGAIVPGVSVIATELATGVERTAFVNEQGVFRIAAMPPGRYSVRAELTGFRTVTMTNIELLSSEVRDLGKLVLQVGTQNEQVTVTAEVTPVQVATSSRTSAVTSDQLTNIQMKGRDIYGLLAILPGVQDTNLNRDFTTWTSMRDVTINGAPVVNKNILIDGISVVDEGGTGNAFVNPNIDAVGEVQVIANGYTAENGRNNGGLINMVTKSGTNSFKGSGWYNARRDSWNENDFLRKAQGLPKPLYRVNITGYSIGGPVVIPKVFDSRSASKKIYFFASQEYTDDARPSVVVTSNLPTELERRGDFSQTRQSNGSILPIIDPRTGQPFPGNIIPQDRINTMGQRLLNLLPMPNGYVNPQAGQQFSANFAFDQTPLHSRTNHVVRIDGAISNSVRWSTKFVKDREDNWTNSVIAPGVGLFNNFVPGIVWSGNVTQVLSSRLVNEINAGYGRNNYGFRAEDDFDYRQFYRSVAGLDPPRLKGFGAYVDPPVIEEPQTDEWPYLPILSFNGGNRTNLASFNSMTSNGRVLPAANWNRRWSVQDDLSWTRGRHNMKFGFYTEYTLKTEPQSPDYMGNFNFGSNATNPLDTGYGYANALLGAYQTYTEQSNRFNMDRRHWQTEGYLQDSWKVSPSFTLDYGVRLTHSGPFYDVGKSNSGFYPELWTNSQAPRLYRPVCTDGRPGNQACPQNLRGAVDPANPSQVLSFAYVGNIVPGTGSQINGMKTDGPDGKGGGYYTLPYLVAAPRVGFAWDLTGDGKTALRASAGIFYNYPRGGYSWVGAPPVAFSRVIRNATIDDIANFATAGVQFAESPINSNVVLGSADNRRLEKSYNVNVAFQRDIGFRTVVEIAYVGNFTRDSSRTFDLNPIPLYAYGDVNNLFNNAAISPNFLRYTYPGMGSINRTFTDLETLRYNAMQFNVQRRLSKGLQMGLAYTLAKGEGMQGYDQYAEQIGGEAALRARYWGPTPVDRKHNLVVNYSYQLPNPAPNAKVLNLILGDWQVSGVTKFLSGAAATPTCTSTNPGIANADPTLTGQTARCMLVGDPFSGFTEDPDESKTITFNTAAFAMAQPLSPTVGNFGNTPTGILRQPSWSNWDVTLAKRIPVHMGKNGQVRLQFQAYNIFNQVEFTTIGTTFQFTGPNNSINNNTQTGRYTVTTPPRQIGITVRLDF
jgi:Carboxypeptidase regulatory-like domain/TonB-dependent Receptor Plug Domain